MGGGRSSEIKVGEVVRDEGEGVVRRWNRAETAWVRSMRFN